MIYTTPQIDEFRDVYSDDLCFIRDGRTLCLEKFGPELTNAAFCRMAIVCVVGTVELCLVQWHTQDKTVLKDYFGMEPNASNEARLKSIESAFCRHNLSHHIESLHDYLAIKYMRNTLVHSRWRKEEKEYVGKRGFPTDMRKFDSLHWERIIGVYEQMLLALHAYRQV